MKKAFKVVLVSGFLMLTIHAGFYHASAAQPPKGEIESLSTTPYISSQSVLTGWTLNDHGCYGVMIAIDGNGLDWATVSQTPRTDIESKYPGYASDAYGYSFTFGSDADKISPGTHTLQVFAYGNDGSYTLESQQIIKQPQRMDVAYVGNNSIVNSNSTTFNVNGWMLNESGFGTVNVYLDSSSTPIATTSAGSSRPELPNYFSGYPDEANCGFSFDISTRNIAQGSHTLTIRGVGKDGEVSTIYRSFTLGKNPPLSAVESFSTGSYINSRSVVSGWALNDSGCYGVMVAIDGNGIGWANVNPTPRTEIKQAHPDYTGDAYGYSYTLGDAVNRLSVGRHTVQVFSYGNDGSVSIQNIPVEKQPQRMDVAYINNGNAINSNASTFNVNGWVLSEGSFGTVSVYLDASSSPIASTSTGSSRPELPNYFSGYNDETNSGFSFDFPTRSIAPGSHTLTIRAAGRDGEVSTIYRSFTIYKNPALSAVESFSTGSYINSQSVISGWALNDSGCYGVMVAIDGNGIGWANVNPTPRTEIKQAHPEYTGDAYGFSYTIGDAVNRLSVGRHTVQVFSYGNDGSVSIQNISVEKEPQRFCVGYLSNNAVFNSNSSTFNVNGWMLNAGWAGTVEFYLDGSTRAFASVTANSARPELPSYFSGYANETESGFTYDVPIQNIPVGNHTLTIKAIGRDGEVSTDQKAFSIFKNPPLSSITSYNTSPYLTSDSVVSGWMLNDSGCYGVMIAIDGNGIGWASYNPAPINENTTIKNRYPGYVANAYDWSYTLGGAVNGIKPGDHTIQVFSYGYDGSVSVQSLKVTKVSQVVSVDTPTSGQSVDIMNGTTLNVSGIAGNAGGVQKVELFVNGSSSPYATVSANLSSRNVAGAVNASACGYNFSIDLNSLPSLVNNLTVKVTGNDGSVSTASAAFNLWRTHGRMDSISIDQFNVTVAGWALNYRGVRNAILFVDNDTANAVNANYGLSSPSIASSYSFYPQAANCNYSGTINTSRYSSGLHWITVRVFNNDGSYTDYCNTIQVPQKISVPFSISLSTLAADNHVSASSIDPNALSANSVDVYQFMNLNWVDGITADEINAILQDDYNTYIVQRGYRDPSTGNANDVLLGHGADFIQAARDHDINVLYLVCHTIEETGHGTSRLANGIYVAAGTYSDSHQTVTVASSGTYYNLFGIHAYDSNPIADGSQYAGSQNWNSVSSALEGAAAWIQRNYTTGVHYAQNTLYEMKWDPYGWSHSGPYEYATDTDWAHNIAEYIYRYSYVLNGVNVKFDVPSFQ